MTASNRGNPCPDGCARKSCDDGCSPDALSGGAYEHLNCLVATAEGEWWECDCGRPLEEPSTPGTTVQCPCGQQWRFDRWPLGHHLGDGETTEVEPRRI
ncbi:MAG: hypothetical protein HPY83_10535 [Anaerolineae bacterium]|nr:hypothetical protein [Anaerolineae bacterium]